jgi:hypothetical protein
VIKSGVRKLLDKLLDDFGKVVVKSSELRHNKYYGDDDLRIHYFLKDRTILGNLGYLVSLRVVIDNDNEDNSHIEITHGMVPGSKIREFNKEFYHAKYLPTRPRWRSFATVPI